MLAVALLHLVGDELVEIVGEHTVGRIDQRRLHADCAELFGQLGADVAGTDHHNRFRVVRALLDLHRVVPVLAQLHAVGFDAGDRRHHWARTGRDHELVEPQRLRVARLQAMELERLAGHINVGHVGAHVHCGAELLELGRRGIEHLARVGHMVAHPQRDAA